METTVFLAVLAAAAMHAGWNAVVKIGLDSYLAVTLIGVATGLVALACLPFVPTPTGTIWFWVVGSAALHTGYKLFLVEAYRSGDLGQVYPIARGAAPLLVAVFGALFLGERPGPLPAAGIAALVLGVWLMSLRGGGLARMARRGIFFAIGTACFIAAYTIVDGLGARRAGHASGFVTWLLAIDGAFMLAICLARRGAGALPAMAAAWKSGLAGGVMSLGAYWIAIWAMTKAPIAAVAALRETSVLFALLISTLFLHEPLTRWRLAAAALIVLGAMAVRLA
ncbi:MAG: EamA family transporter [Alphaproteobacteria bacterium]|nr:EamA family transporter [Alphaproteobacteria bacterium]